MNMKLMKSIAVFTFVFCLILTDFVHSQNGISATKTTIADVPSTQTVVATSASEDTIDPDATSGKSTAEPAITSQNPTSPTTLEPKATTPEPEITSTAGPDPTTIVEPETPSTAGPDPKTTVQPEATTTVEARTTNPPQSESTTVDAKTTTQTEETTGTTESNENIEEIGEKIAEKLFENVGKLQKQSDPMGLTNYDLNVLARLGLVTANVHYELKNCILSGTSRIKSRSIHPTSHPRSPVQQFRGFAEIDKLWLRCGGYTSFFGFRRPLKLSGDIEGVMMRVNFKNYRKSGDVVIDSLTLQRIKEIDLDLKIDHQISLTKYKFLEHFRVDLHSSIAILVRDVIARDARRVAASLKVQ